MKISYKKLDGTEVDDHALRFIITINGSDYILSGSEKLHIIKDDYRVLKILPLTSNSIDLK